MTDGSQTPSKTIRAMMDWKNGDTIYIAFGACSRLYVAKSGDDNSDLNQYTYQDITPETDIGITVDDPTPRVGYGSGVYGEGRPYGRERTDASSDLQPTTVWLMDLWGNKPVFQPTTFSGGRFGELYTWDLGTGRAVHITGSPRGCRAFGVQTERYCMVFGTATDSTVVHWCDRENINDWRARPENEAGSYNLRTEGTPMAAVPFQGKMLLITSKDAHAAQPTGPPFIQGFRTLHENCGIVSPRAHAETGEGSYWMGVGNFYVYDGVKVKELDCDLESMIIDDINLDYAGKIHAVNDARNSCIIWFYASSGATEIDSYIIYNYVYDWWSNGKSNRTAGLSSRIFENSLFVDKDSNLFWHDKLLAYRDVNGDLEEDDLPFAETTAMAFDDDNRVVEINEIIPDLAGEDIDGVSFRLKSRMSLHGKETITPTEDKDGLTVDSGRENIRLRVSGKQFKLRLEGKNGKDWSLGNVRFKYGVRGRQ